MSKKTSDAIKILDRLTGDDPELREMIAEERLKAQGRATRGSGSAASPRVRPRPEGTQA